MESREEVVVESALGRSLRQKLVIEVAVAVAVVYLNGVSFAGDYRGTDTLSECDVLCGGLTPRTLRLVNR